MNPSPIELETYTQLVIKAEKSLGDLKAALEKPFSNSSQSLSILGWLPSSLRKKNSSEQQNLLPDGVLVSKKIQTQLEEINSYFSQYKDTKGITSSSLISYLNGISRDLTSLYISCNEVDQMPKAVKDVATNLQLLSNESADLAMRSSLHQMQLRRN